MKEKLPSDTALLQSMLEAQIKQNQQLQLKMDKMQQQLDSLLRLLYGKKSEKQSSSKDKGNDDKPDKPSTPSSQNNKTNTTTPSGKNKPKRKALPKDLLRERIEYTLPEQACLCSSCQSRYQVIDEELSEQLDFIPARLIVKQHVRYKYACKNGCEIKTAPFPAQPIDKSIAGAGLLSEILINKYQDALPLYRQIQRFKRHDIHLSESTLCDWVMQCADRLQPLVLAMKADLLRQKKLHTDDTPIPVLAKGKTKTARLWTYVADHFCEYPIVIYDYTPTRAQSGPMNFLSGFKGFLQADAYNGYDVLYQSGDIIEVGCLAHTRRKFFEIAQTVKQNSLAHDALTKIAAIYHVETTVKQLDYQQRYYYRKKYLKPLYRQLHHWLRRYQKKTLDKTPIRQAINYVMTHWRALQNVLADGRLQVDNNTAERAIKPVVIGRKNYLFAGSDEGGKRAAIIYSIIETCKQNAINTFDYLRDVLTRLPTHKANKIHELLPYNWTPLTI